MTADEPWRAWMNAGKEDIPGRESHDGRPFFMERKARLNTMFTSARIPITDGE
jgi:hypothetical protein